MLGGTPELRDPDWCRLQAPGSPLIAFQRVPEPKTTKNRLHLDVLVDDIEVRDRRRPRRSARPGSARAHHDVAGSFQVLADPEGNEWCVVSPA